MYVNNVAATHTAKNGILTVNLGDIAAGKTVTVTFKAKINGDMYNQTIYNTAAAVLVTYGAVSPFLTYTPSSLSS